MASESLRRRNAVWARLRILSPDSPQFGAACQKLRDLTGWSRARVLAGLGLTETEAGAK